MDNLFNNILVNSGDGITVLSSVIAIIVALVFVLLIAGTYYITQEDETYQRSMSVSLLMLPVILSVVILFVCAIDNRPGMCYYQTIRVGICGKRITPIVWKTILSHGFFKVNRHF